MIRSTSFLILLVFLTLVPAQEMTVGVMPFTNNSLSEKEALESLSKGLADMMTTELSKIKSLKMIERADLAKIIQEMGLSQSGLVDESSAKEAGKLLGADMLMLGSFNQGFDGEMRIDARLVKVETGETMKAEEVTGKKKKLFNMIKKLSFAIADDLDLKLSKDEKKALDNPQNEDMDALMAFSKGLDAEDKGDFKTAKEMYAKALSINKDYTRAQERLKIVESKTK
jgi:TolB-like protein